MKMFNKLRPHLHYLLAAGFFLLVTLFFTFPLILHFRDSIVGGYGDGLYFAWLIRWYQRVIIEHTAAPFFNPMMNFPEGWNLSTTDTALASSLPGVPFSLLWGPIAGYNIAMWITFILSGLAMYIWVFQLTKSKSASLIGGTIYAFLPYRIAHFQAGHLNLSGTAWLPLYFMGLYQLMSSRRRWNWWASIYTAISLGLIGLSSMYYLYFSLLMTVIFIAAFLIFENWLVLRDRWFYFRALTTAAISLPLLYVALKPFLALSSQGGLADRSIAYANQYSASPTDFFTPASSQFLFGAPISHLLDRSLWMESSLYIGVFTFILIIIAILVRGKMKNKPLLFISLTVMASAFLLALGPDLHWNNQILHITNPFSGQESSISLPAKFLFVYLPYFAKMRAVLRVGVFTLLFAALAAGLGASALLQKAKPHLRNWVTLILVVLILIDFYPGFMQRSLVKIEARPVDYWLALQPDSGAVVQMPFEESTSQAQVYFTLFHHKAITGGFFNANQPPQYQYLQGILATFPDENSVAALKEYKVAYIVINPHSFPDYDIVKGKMLALGLFQLTEQDGIDVFGFQPSR